MLTGECALREIRRIFPDGAIFADTYYKVVPLAVSQEVRRQAKEKCLSSAQWLSSNGFFWKETGYVEPDMLQHDNAVVSNDAFSLADSILKKYALAGEYILSDEQANMLYKAAREVVERIPGSEQGLKAEDYVVLTLETIELLKSWSSEPNNDDEVSGTFWNYIYLQYGFNPENSDTASKRLYGQFRRAIQYTLEHYHRFFAPEGTKRYYTTLLLHAMAPAQSIEALLNILFDFYDKTSIFNIRRTVSATKRL